MAALNNLDNHVVNANHARTNDMEKIILYLDSSVASEELRKAIKRTGTPFEAFHRAPSKDVPAIETPYGTIRGLDNIYRYFDLTPREPKS